LLFYFAFHQLLQQMHCVYLCAYVCIWFYCSQ